MVVTVILIIVIIIINMVLSFVIVLIEDVSETVVIVLVTEGISSVIDSVVIVIVILIVIIIRMSQLSPLIQFSANISPALSKFIISDNNKMIIAWWNGDNSSCLPLKHIVSNVLHDGDSEAERRSPNGPVHLLAVTEHLPPAPGWENLAVAHRQLGSGGG